MKTQLLKINQALLFLVLFTVILYYARQILIPVVLAAMLSMLMAPLCRKLDNKGWSRTWSCIVCVSILLVAMLLVFGLIMAQVSSLLEDLPLFEKKTNELLDGMKSFIERKFEVPVEQQTAILITETKNLSKSLRAQSTKVLADSLALIAGLVITLAFSFLMLYHKERYHAFFLNYNTGNQPERGKILDNIAQVAQRYLVGRAISITILFILYAIALWVIGIEGALLLAGIGALVNIIPYLGPLLAGVFPFFVALVTSDSVQPAIWVIITFSVIQGIDNYFVTPYVLGGEVSLSALSTIVIIICGGFIWGIAGMILFVPLLSIAKIIFDAVPDLQPYGYLVGDQGSRPSASLMQWFRNLFGGKGKKGSRKKKA